MTSHDMTRRAWIALAATVPASAFPPPTILDTHIHLFDTGRKQGVPWPEPKNTVLYRPALPERYAALSKPLGIRGAIAVEASPWLEDNQWLLDLAGRHPLIRGVAGNLDPEAPEFSAVLDRLARNPLLRGLRYGNLWGRDLATAVTRPVFIEGMRAVAAHGLTLDTANPNAALLGGVLRLTDRVPELRVVLDHLPQADPAALPWAEFKARPQVYVKLSGVLRRVDGKVPADPAFYRDRADRLFDTFGPSRVMFGSDWPNCDQWGPLDLVVRVARALVAGRGEAVEAACFSGNAHAAYRLTRV